MTGTTFNVDPKPAPEAPADLEYRVGKLTLAPGDVLIVKVEGALPRHVAQRVADQVRAIVGNDAKIMVLDSVIDLSVLTRAEIEERAA